MFKLINKIGYLGKKIKAFTLVEVVIALAIIGVVTVVTLPTLQANIQETVFKVKKKVFHSRVATAVMMMQNLKTFHNGEEFVEKYRETMNLHMVCGQDKFFGCDLPQTFTGTDGNIFPMPRTWGQLNPKLVDMFYEDIETGEIYEYHQEDFDSIAFITDNGESVNLFFNPVCAVNEVKDNPNYFSAASVCINIIYDLNGPKPPNTVGHDIGFLTAFKPIDPMVVSIVPHNEDLESKVQSVAAGRACTEVKSSLRAPTDYEIAGLFVNSKYLGMHDGFYWSSTIHSPEHAWYLWGATGLVLRGPNDRNTEMDLRCIER